VLPVQHLVERVDVLRFDAAGGQPAVFEGALQGVAIQYAIGLQRRSTAALAATAAADVAGGGGAQLRRKKLVLLRRYYRRTKSCRRRRCRSISTIGIACRVAVR